MLSFHVLYAKQSLETVKILHTKTLDASIFDHTWSKFFSTTVPKLTFSTGVCY